MTVAELKRMCTDVLTPKDIAGCLGCTAYAINQQAAADASKLGFPVIRIGKRVKIPRLAFIKYMEGAKEEA